MNKSHLSRFTSIIHAPIAKYQEGYPDGEKNGNALAPSFLSVSRQGELLNIYTAAGHDILSMDKGRNGRRHKECITMPTLQFPCTIFKPQKRMDDYGAEDMRCGDLSESQLKNTFNLADISARVNPFTLTKITPFSQPQSLAHGSRDKDKKRTVTIFQILNLTGSVFSVSGLYSSDTVSLVLTPL